MSIPRESERVDLNRHQHIIAPFAEYPFLSVEELKDGTGVSAAPIRHDLVKLEKPFLVSMFSVE